jgi:iduronate 2-sulfatase
VVLSLRRAYYAAVSYTDSNIGVVLDSLETLGMANTTLITFWGDHGWQLVEHGEWDKHTNFDLATHAPLLFRSPGLTDGGVVTYQLAETVDIFPTLVDLALGRKIDRCPADSSKVLTCTEGTSLRALIASPQTPLKDAAFSVYSRGIPRTPPSSEVGTVEVDGQGPNGPAPSNCLDLEGKGRGCAMGYTMLTRIDGSLVRYTEWVHFPGPSNAWRPRWDTSYGTELYNHSVDPGENVNVYTSVRGTELASRLQARLHKGSEANGNA